MEIKSQYSLFKKLIFPGVWLFYNVILVSTEQQSESAICVCVCVYVHIYPLFFGFPSHLGQSRALSGSLSYTVGSH